MKLIVGLGNPGQEFEKTRHNVGFIMVERFAQEHSLKWQLKGKFKTELAEGEIDGEKVLLAKPQTFMNESGEAVRGIVDFYHLKHHDTLVLHDDADMDWGRLRTVEISQPGGHRGVESLAAHGLEGVWRLKIGVSNEHRLPGQAIDFVLTRFKAEEWDRLDDLYKAVHPILRHFVAESIETTTSSW